MKRRTRGNAEIQRRIERGTSAPASHPSARQGARLRHLPTVNRKPESVVARRAMTAEQRRQKLVPKIEGGVVTTPLQGCGRCRPANGHNARKGMPRPLGRADRTRAGRHRPRVWMKIRSTSASRSTASQEIPSGGEAQSGISRQGSLGSPTARRSTPWGRSPQVMVNAAETIRSMNYLPGHRYGDDDGRQFAFFHCPGSEREPFDLRPHQARETLIEGRVPGREGVTHLPPAEPPERGRAGRPQSYEQKPYYGENTATLIDGRQLYSEHVCLVDLVRSRRIVVRNSPGVAGLSGRSSQSGPYGHGDARHMGR